MDIKVFILAYFGIALVIGIICLVVTIVKVQQNKSNHTNTQKQEPIQQNKSSVIKSTDNNIIDSYKQAYKREYLLTINERNQYWKLRQWADSRKMIVFTKVRLLDLISPRSNQRNYKTLLWKIQAKHVDFVICDTNINVKCIVEIMDSSHNQPDRIERDRFVREVLTACGYRIIQTYNVNPDTLDKVCGFYKEIRHDGETVAADETGRTV